MVKTLRKLALSFMTLTLFTSCITINQVPQKFDYPIDSFVKMEIYLEDTLVGSGSGSVVGHSERGTHILTASHVCSPSRLQMRALLSGQEVSIKADEQEAKVYSHNPEIDVCIMTVEEGLEELPALEISEKAPVVGGEYFTISSPLGIASTETGLVGLFSGLYLGTREFSEHTKAMFSVPSAGGSSGAAIFNRDKEVVSITTHGFRSFSSSTIGPQYEDFYAFVTISLTMLNGDY